MTMLGLADKAAVTSSSLSHGDQKLLDIGLALALEPRVLLLDEPTAGMGPEERWQMIAKVQELWERQKMTLIFIEHDMDIVFKIAQTIRVLCYGRVLGRRHAERNPRPSGSDRRLSGHQPGDARLMSARVLFSAQKIDVFYGSSQILFGVDIALAEGQTMALLGPQRRRQERRR